MLRKLTQTFFQYGIAYRNHNLITTRLAGHSKWKNIKHTKELKDGAKSRLTTKLCRMLRVACVEGGSPNPATNTKLDQVVEQCRRNNIPNATVQRVLKAQEVNKDEYKSALVEMKGPGGCMILCEILTSNLIRTKQLMSGILRKSGGCHTSGILNNFEHIGIIETELPISLPSDEAILEHATSSAIECDAEEVELTEDGEKLLQFSCKPHNLRNVEKKLEEAGYKIRKSSAEFIPYRMSKLSDSELESCSKLYEKLEAMDEVVKLHDNIE